VCEDVFFGIFPLKLDVVILLEKLDPERLSELLELRGTRDEREPLRRETIQKESEIEVVFESNIVIDFHLDIDSLGMFHHLKYLQERSMSFYDESLFIHIGR